MIGVDKRRTLCYTVGTMEVQGPLAQQAEQKTFNL